MAELMVLAGRMVTPLLEQQLRGEIVRDRDAAAVQRAQIWPHSHPQIESSNGVLPLLSSFWDVERKVFQVAANFIRIPHPLLYQSTTRANNDAPEAFWLDLSPHAYFGVSTLTQSMSAALLVYNRCCTLDCFHL